MFRSYSDVESGRIHTSPHRMAHNLSRTPNVTKEMLQKLHNTDLGPKRSVLCGYELNTRRVSLLLALFILFLLSSGAAVLMWCTTAYSNYVLSLMVISSDSGSFQGFVRPVPNLAKIYIFNYTNVDDVEAGYADKLNVQELGPFTYRESTEKININFNEDGSTVSYEERHGFNFIPELSIGHKQNDRIIVPNIPVLAAAAMSKNSFYLTRLAMSSLFRTFNAKSFLNLPAHDFIFGYDDDFYNLAKGVLALSNPLPFEKFGLLAGRKGVLKDAVEIYTGKDNINKLSTVKSLGGKTSFNQWLTEECNNFHDASETINFPPHQIQNKQPINTVWRDICRKLPFEFESEVKIMNETLLAYRYKTPTNMFGHPSVNNPLNQGYCDMNGACPPHGLFNATTCSYGTPLFISHPHFKFADPKLFDAVTGLNPNPKNYESVVDIHPKLGYIIQGWNRLQINVQVKKSFGITQLSMFEDEMYIPVAWMEFGGEIAEQSEEIKQLVYDTTFLVDGIELAFKLTSVLMAAITFVILLLAIRTNCCSKSKTLLHRTEPGEVRLI